MGSIRSRLTIEFTALLVGIMILFCAAMLLSHRTMILSALEARLAQELDEAQKMIDLVMQTTKPIYVTKALSAADSSRTAGTEARTAELLELLPEYVLVNDANGSAFYRSELVRKLDRRDSVLFDSAARTMPAKVQTRLIRLSHEQVLISKRNLNGARASQLWIGTGAESARIFPTDLAATILITAPFLLALSLSGAYAIAGRAFSPVDRIIDQVEAISDGRSLHRRLAIGAAGDELSRLSSTLNAMIERLETSFGALRRFTADASHELKTPLTVIRADVERSMSPQSTSTEKDIALEEALQQVTRMTDLVESLLTLARADEGRFDLHREPVQMSDLTREVVETARLLGEMAGLTIDVPVMEDAEVLGDATRLRQLFLNLVTNAIKYTSRGGRVEITLSCADEQVLFSVRDTGIGIAAADLPYIFERFWRADRARSRASERGGFGLGLAICQWIAQAHGGSLTVESRLGRGSRFVAILPLSKSA